MIGSRSRSLLGTFGRWRGRVRVRVRVRICDVAPFTGEALDLLDHQPNELSAEIFVAGAFVPRMEVPDEFEDQTEALHGTGDRDRHVDIPRGTEDAATGLGHLRPDALPGEKVGLGVGVSYWVWVWVRCIGCEGRCGRGLVSMCE